MGVLVGSVVGDAMTKWPPTCNPSNPIQFEPQSVGILNCSVHFFHFRVLCNKTRFIALSSKMPVGFGSDMSPFLFLLLQIYVDISFPLC